MLLNFKVYTHIYLNIVDVQVDNLTSEILHVINKTIEKELVVITHHKFSLYTHMQM